MYFYCGSIRCWHDHVSLVGGGFSSHRKTDSVCLFLFWYSITHHTPPIRMSPFSSRDFALEDQYYCVCSCLFRPPFHQPSWLIVYNSFQCYSFNIFYQVFVFKGVAHFSQILLFTNRQIFTCSLFSVFFVTPLERTRCLLPSVRGHLLLSPEFLLGTCKYLGVDLYVPYIMGHALAELGLGWTASSPFYFFLGIVWEAVLMVMCYLLGSQLFHNLVLWYSPLEVWAWVSHFPAPLSLVLPLWFLILSLHLHYFTWPSPPRPVFVFG